MDNTLQSINSPPNRIKKPYDIGRYVSRRRNYTASVPGQGGGGGTGGGTLPTFVNLAQAARAAGARYLLTYNQAYPAQSNAYVAGIVNTAFGLPGLDTKYYLNLQELQDTNGVAMLAGTAGSLVVTGALTTNGVQIAGAWNLVLKAGTSFSGTIVPGDKFVVSGQTYYSTGTVAASGTSVTVPISPQLGNTNIANATTVAYTAMTTGTAGTALSANIPALAALQGPIWQKGRIRVDEIRAVAANKGLGVVKVDSDGAGTNKKYEVYLTLNSAGTTFTFSFAPYMTGSVRVIVCSTPSILLTALPPNGCFLNWNAGYNPATGALAVEFRDDGGALILDTEPHSSTGTASVFPVFTGSLVTNALVNTGATSIVLAATTLTGTLAIGSTFTIGGTVYTATAAATASANTLTVTVAATAGSIAAGSAASFTSGALMNTDGGANGRVTLGAAFNGAVSACAKVLGGLAIYGAALPAAGSVTRYQPGTLADAGLIGLWSMGDGTSNTGALASLASAINGGPALTVTGVVRGQFDVGSMNCWSVWPNGPGGLCVDESQWAEFHMVATCVSPTSMTFNTNPGPFVTVALCRQQGTASRAYMFEGEGGVNSVYNGVVTNSTTAAQAIQTYVTGVVGAAVAAFGTAAQGGIREWNIANEFFQGGVIQSSTWSPLTNWYVVAAQAVYAVDPTAMIMINLNNIELSGDSAQQAGMRTAVQNLINAGIPANQIIAGHEFHLSNVTGFNPATDGPAFKNHVNLLAALGVWWCPSECDVTDKAMDGGSGNPNTAARAARQALNVTVWNNFFASVMTADPTSWTNVWSFGGWQKSTLTSWINTNALGSGIERLDGDFQYCDLLDENYNFMGGAGSSQDCYGAWMTFFAAHAGGIVPAVTPTLPPEMPAGLIVLVNTGPIAPANGASITGTKSSGTFVTGGPVSATFTRNGGDSDIAFSSGSLNPDGSTNTDVQTSGIRVGYFAGKTNDPAVNLFADFATQGTGTAFLSYYERWQPVSGWGALFTGTGLSGTPAMNSEDSKIWAPVDVDSGGDDLTVMGPMVGLAPAHPVFGLNFQGSDGANIPDTNATGASDTTPVTSAFYMPGPGVWSRQSVSIVANGTLGTSTVTFWINGNICGSATGVTTATAWSVLKMYASRSVYSGTQTATTYKDIDKIVWAVK